MCADGHQSVISERLFHLNIDNFLLLNDRLDEADVFLEKRTINDINRCALVGIFLRLLEYHDGIIFLTTNRVECFDPAFKSRISMALHYEDLTSDARATIWKQLSEKMVIYSR